MVVAIDGPSGAGKSTIARTVAKDLGFGYLDTGALYRVLAAGILEEEKNPANQEDVGSLLTLLNVELYYKDSEQQTYLNGIDYSDRIRTPEVSMGASHIASYPEVREKLLLIQRSAGETQDIIVDGRDIGTVVFPDAPVKIFLTASPESRAERRMAQDAERGVFKAYDEVYEDIILRDQQDTEREIAPLLQAPDAILVDTTNKTLEESIAWVKQIIKNQQG